MVRGVADPADAVGVPQREQTAASELHDIRKAAETAKAQRQQKVEQYAASVADVMRRIESLAPAADRHDGAANGHAPPAAACFAEQRAGVGRLLGEFEDVLLKRGAELGEQDASIMLSELRMAILEAELASRASLRAAAEAMDGLLSQLSDPPAGPASEAAAAERPAPPARKQRWRLPPTPSIITADPNFSLEPDLDTLEQWEQLLSAASQRKAFLR